jgi:archaeosine-15-forming tRNA-guanine transglycosylase
MLVSSGLRIQFGTPRKKQSHITEIHIPCSHSTRMKSISSLNKTIYTLNTKRKLVSLVASGHKLVEHGVKTTAVKVISISYTSHTIITSGSEYMYSII